MTDIVTAGQITLTDLIDTATYIYYSANLDGNNPTIKPMADSQYIGFYSGPLQKDGQPLPGSEAFIKIEGSINWSRYKGEDGTSAPQTQVKYGESKDSPEEEWISIFDPLKHHYAKYSYDGGTTWTEPIKIVGEDGINGTGYIVESNENEIVKFIGSSEQVEFIPYQIIFSIYEIKDNKRKKILSPASYKITLFFQKINLGVVKSDKYDVTFLFNADKLGNISLNISELTQSSSSVILESEEQQEAKVNLINCLERGEGYLVFDYQNSGEVIATKVVAIRFGIDSELANFQITASAINSAIKDTKMSFNKNGLDIFNGGITIYKGNNINSTKSMWIDKSGELFLNGNGIFNGSVYANDGIFSGVVHAKKGTFSDEILVLGDLSIGTTNKILIGTAKGREGIFTEDFSEANNTGFYFDTNGTIFANSILLGKNAKIKEFLQIGENCQISVPNSNNSNNFISVKNNQKQNVFSLDNLGNIHLGQDDNGLVLSGEKSSIYSKNFVPKVNGWSLSNDQAEFNNVIVRGTIQDSVLVHGQVQTVGGTLVVRPSFSIKKTYKHPKEDLYIVIPSLSTVEYRKINVIKQEYSLGKFYILKDGKHILSYLPYDEQEQYYELSGELAGINIGDYCQIGGKEGQTEVYQIFFIDEEVNEKGKNEQLVYLKPLGVETWVDKNFIPKIDKYYHDLKVENEKTSKVNFLTIKDPQKNGVILQTKTANNSKFLVGYRENIGNEEKVGETLAFKTKENILLGPYEQDFSESNSLNGKTLVTLCSSDTTSGQEKIMNNVGIAISASQNPGYAPESISVFTNELKEIKDKDGATTLRRELNRENKIILGNLGESGVYGGLTGYGLYAENVYLKGQLISGAPAKAEQPSFYSGINTSSNIQMPNPNNIYFPGDIPTGSILFWAGAKNNSKEEIEKAPFKVDTYGNLYANSGYFSGTIITNATISASTLRAAVIEGWDPSGNEGSGQYASLTIKDTDKAICFKNNDSIKLTVGKDNIFSSLPFIVGLNSNKDSDTTVIGIDGGIHTKTLSLRKKIINNDQSSYSEKRINITNEKVSFYKNLEEKGNYSYNYSADQIETTIKKKKITAVNEEGLELSKSLFLSSNIEIRQVKDDKAKTIGCDLYFKE